jgi:hypothetical protein
MAVVFPAEEPLTRRQGFQLRAWLKGSRKFRAVSSALLKPMDVILDSLQGLPGVGALTEIKDGTAALLDYAQDIDERKLD